MKVFGLTGGMGMGKSTSERLLRERGVRVADTDAIARRIVEPGQPALEEIKAAFGAGVIQGDGCLDRAALAKRVFPDQAALKQLESIVHPRIRRIWLEQVEAWRSEGVANAVVVIPLLFETHSESYFDSTICIACTLASQMERLRGRGWDADDIESRLRSQMPPARKMELSNFVVWTEGSLAMHARQLDRIIS